MIRGAPQPILTNPPQVVESINYQRPVERTTTSNIIENIQGTSIPVKQSESLVTSNPSGFGENKLQQQRVISQTYAIKE